jgi:hypothetical protein
MTDADKFVHDMKNLLGIVLGYGSILADDLAGDGARRADLQQITKAAEDALTLLERWAASSREGA